VATRRVGHVVGCVFCHPYLVALYHHLASFCQCENGVRLIFFGALVICDLQFDYLLCIILQLLARHVRVVLALVMGVMLCCFSRLLHVEGV
jgi:hypothetical protein